NEIIKSKLEKVDYIRGYFDAEGGIAKSPKSSNEKSIFTGEDIVQALGKPRGKPEQGQMEAEEIRDFFTELSPFIQAPTKDEKAQQVEADFKKGKDNSLIIKSLLDVFNRLVALSQKATQEKAELLIELLEPFVIIYNPNSPRGKKQWYESKKIGVLESGRGRKEELKTTLEKLRAIKEGTAQTEENTANQDNNNQTNETNNNNDQTNNNDAQLAAEKKVKVVIKAANAALTSSDLGVVEKATAELTDLQFSNNQLERGEFNKQGGGDLVEKILNRQEQLKNSGPQGENNQKDDPIQPDRAAAITEIANKLTETGVKTSELSNDYHDYQAKMKGFTNLNQINNFKNNMLAAIAAKAQEKQDAEQMDDKVRNNSQKTGAELNEALKEIADDHGKK
ncbi:30752_t:CDS:2, partial [Racocetra persica]